MLHQFWGLWRKLQRVSKTTTIKVYKNHCLSFARHLIMANMICIWEVSVSSPIHLGVLHVFTCDLLQQCSQGLRWTDWSTVIWILLLVTHVNQVPLTFVWNPGDLNNASLYLPLPWMLHHVQGLRDLEGLRTSLASENHSIKGTLAFLMTLVTMWTILASNMPTIT